jgi:hypothetical protein
MEFDQSAAIDGPEEAGTTRIHKRTIAAATE